MFQTGSPGRLPMKGPPLLAAAQRKSLRSRCHAAKFPPLGPPNCDRRSGHGIARHCRLLGSERQKCPRLLAVAHRIYSGLLRLPGWRRYELTACIMA